MSDVDQKVTRLFGVHALADGEVDEKCVEMLEHYLGQARRGEIVGIAVAGVRPNRATWWDWTCGSAPANLLVAAVTMLGHETIAAVVDQCLEAPHEPDPSA